MVGNYNEAEDLMQEIWIKAWKGEFIPRAEKSAWLFRIARNHVIDYIRTKKRSPGNFQELTIGIPSQYLNPEQELISKEGMAIIKQAIDNLNPELRKIINLRIEGMTYKEISKQLNVPIGTIDSYIYRIRKKLKT